MSTPSPIIDMWAPLVPTHEIIDHAQDHFPNAMLGYLSVFFKQPPEPETARALIGGLEQSDEEVLAKIGRASCRERV